jgi:hypothetical protein
MPDRNGVPRRGNLPALLSFKFRRNDVWQALYDLCVLNEAVQSGSAMSASFWIGSAVSSAISAAPYAPDRSTRAGAAGRP